MSRALWIVIMPLVAFVLGFVARAHLGEEAKGRGRVTSIGGIFFKARHPQQLKDWYARHLGLHTDRYGTVFEWRRADDSTRKGFTQWSVFSDSTKYFEPSGKDFMINYRVQNLGSLVADLRSGGVTILDTIETYDYGQFVHILDAEGNKIELWQPDDEAYNKISGGATK